MSLRPQLVDGVFFSRLGICCCTSSADDVSETVGKQYYSPFSSMFDFASTLLFCMVFRARVWRRVPRTRICRRWLWWWSGRCAFVSESWFLGNSCILLDFVAHFYAVWGIILSRFLLFTDCTQLCDASQARFFYIFFATFSRKSAQYTISYIASFKALFPPYLHLFKIKSPALFPRSDPNGPNRPTVGEGQHWRGGRLVLLLIFKCFFKPKKIWWTGLRICFNLFEIFFWKAFVIWEIFPPLFQTITFLFYEVQIAPSFWSTFLFGSGAIYHIPGILKFPTDLIYHSLSLISKKNTQQQYFSIWSLFFTCHLCCSSIYCYASSHRIVALPDTALFYWLYF